jgi:hypothetical protein
MHQTTCIMCDAKRSFRSRYCEDCKIYEGHESEFWYEEILRMEQRQKLISRRETFTLITEDAAVADVRGVAIPVPQYQYTKEPGRPRVYGESQRDMVRRLRLQEELPTRTIAKRLNEQGIKISRETVRRIVREMR